MPKFNRVYGAIATVTIFSVCTRIISFIFKIYISRALGAEAIGLYQISLSVFFLFASLSASGIPLVLSRKTAELQALKEKDNFSLFSSALAAAVIFSVIEIALLMLIGDKLSIIFSDRAAYPLFAVMLPALLSTAIYSCVRGWFWGRKEFTAFSVTETIEEVLRIAFSILFLSSIFTRFSGAYAISIAFTVSDIVVAVILMIIFFCKGGKIGKPTRIKEILTPSMPITGMRVFSSLINTLLAIILPIMLISGGMSTGDATASFGRITGMANPLLFAPNAIISSLAIVLIPEMSANGIKKEYDKLNAHLNNGINFSFLISGIFMVLYLALGEEITTLLYADSISGKYLQYATLVMLPMNLCQLTQSALNSIGHEYASFANYIIGNVLMLLCVIFLPKIIGIYSVAVATMVAMLVISALNTYSLRKYIGFDLKFLKYMIMVLLFIFPSSFFAECLNDLLSPYTAIGGLFIGASGGVGAYVLLCYLTKLVDVKGFVKLRKAGN